MRNLDIERAAETQFYIRPAIFKALRNQQLQPAAKGIVGNHETYFEMWEAGFGDKFFDMATLIRLATGIENGLRQFHSSFKSLSTQRGFYQRIVRDTDSATLATKLLGDCGYDVRTSPSWRRMREIMLHRHLYAHRSGVVDEQYIDDLKDLTAVDIRPDLQQHGYPQEDVCWFRPLAQLDSYIEDARKFFSDLPTAS